MLEHNSTVHLRHEAIFRKAFGNGVQFAARHLPEPPNGLFTMEDLMTPCLQLDDKLPAM